MKPRRPRGQLARGLALALLGVPAASAFDIVECDGGNTPGDAAIILGWPAPAATSVGAVVIDDQGTVNSGIPGFILRQLWANSITDWAGTPDQEFAFPNGGARAVTGAELGASLGGGSERIFTVIQPTTTIPAGGIFPTPVTGWTQITGTGDGVLGIALSVFDLTTRSIVDSDIILNDDATGGAPVFAPGAVPGRFNIGTVMRHEIGHFFGLDHAQDPNSIMAPTLGPNTVVNIAADDRNGMVFLYPGADAFLVNPDRNVLRFDSCNQSLDQLIAQAFEAKPNGGCRAAPGAGTAGLIPAALIWLFALASTWIHRSAPRRS